MTSEANKGYGVAEREPAVKCEMLARQVESILNIPGRRPTAQDHMLRGLASAVLWLVDDRLHNSVTESNRALLDKLRDIEERYYPRGVRRAQSGSLTFRDARAVIAALPEIRRALDATWSNLGAVLADRKQLHEHFERAVSDNNRMRQTLAAREQEIGALRNSAQAAVVKVERLRRHVDAAGEIDAVVRGLQSQLPR